MKFAVIGCGSIGQRHIGNLIELGQDVVAWNRNKVRRNLVENKFGIKTYSNLDEMLDIKDLGASVICSPSSLHFIHASKVINKNLNLFIEKPLAINLEGLDTIEYEAKKKGLISHVGTNMRFHFGPALIKKHLEKETIGKVLWANFWAGMYLPDWHPEEDYRNMYSAKKELGGGAVMDFIHEIDLICWMFNKPSKLAAIIGQSGWLDLETEDIADVIMSYPKGLKLNLHIDYLQRPFQRGIHLVGDKGWIKWDSSLKNVVIHFNNSHKVVNESYPSGYKHNNMYMEQMKYFLKCLAEKKQSKSDIQEGRKALELALAIKKSSENNKFL
tara:strand:+ start:596 stop:1579 length:984 start_codon:yes stop_codon:yes gene_type:complete